MLDSCAQFHTRTVTQEGNRDLGTVEMRTCSPGTFDYFLLLVVLDFITARTPFSHNPPLPTGIFPLPRTLPDPDSLESLSPLRALDSQDSIESRRIQLKSELLHPRYSGGEAPLVVPHLLIWIDILCFHYLLDDSRRCVFYTDPIVQRGVPRTSPQTKPPSVHFLSRLSVDASRSSGCSSSVSASVPSTRLWPSLKIRVSNEVEKVVGRRRTEA